MKEVAVVAYCRTGIARAVRGALNRTHGIPMTSHVLRHAVKRAGIDPAEVEDVVVDAAQGRSSAMIHANSRRLTASRDRATYVRSLHFSGRCAQREGTHRERGSRR